jgi:hypothetical protein
MTFIIVEIPEEEIGNCILNAFKYMVENEENHTRWFGSNTYQDCVDYIANYTNNPI